MSLSHPMLLPGVAVLWRGPRALQLGLDPRRAVVLDLPNPAAAVVLDLLDGARPEDGVVAAAGRRGVGEPDVRMLLGILHRLGLIVSARTLLPDPAARAAGERMIAEAAALALSADEPPVAFAVSPGRVAARPAGGGVPPAAPIRVDGTAPPPDERTPRPNSDISVIAGQGASAPGRPARTPSQDPAIGEGASGGPADPPSPPADRSPSPPVDQSTSPPAGRSPSPPAGRSSSPPTDRSSGAAGARAAIPVTPAQILRRRAKARVRVAGRSRLGIPIAVALAAAGVGHVDPALDGTVERGELILAGPARLTPPTESPPAVPAPLDRKRAATAAISTIAPGARVATLQRRDTTLLVQLGPPDQPAAMHSYAYRDVAQLIAGVRDGRALIGPFVPPGGGPCVNCVDLHRTDRDPVWPALAAQLASSTTVEACGTAALLTAVGHAVGEVLRFLDGAPPDLIGSTIEVSGPGRIRRRSWRPHPDCDCTRPRRSRREGVMTVR